MRQQGGLFHLFCIFLILAVVGVGFFCGQKISAAGMVNINTATLDELTSLPGIGLAKAQAIIDYRSIKLFETIEEIMQVTGIKQATFNQIKDLITVSGITATQNEVASTTPEQIETGDTNDSGSSDLVPGEIEINSSEASPIGNFGDLVINEFVSDPADNEVEWIELYNTTSREIDLTGWWIEDGSKAKTKLDGSINISGSGRYKIVEKPSGNLNNNGDIIILYDSSGKIIDQVVYGDWDDGNTGDNAPVAHDPDSVARKFDGYNTFNNANDFAITAKLTKGASNLIEIEDEVSAIAKAGFDFSNDIHISEILPNPVGDDTKLEFIEIHNAGAREVNLIGWSLSNENGKKINLEKIATSTKVQAGEYLVFYRPKSKIVLHNDQGEVRLFEPLADKPAQTVAYKDVKEGWSYNAVDYKTNDQWVWSQTPTPGVVNVIKAVNNPPDAEFNLPQEILAGIPIIFDSSDSDDQDGDDLKYAWDFGDGFKNSLANPEHTFLKSGIYRVQLAVSDGQATTTMEKNVRVVNSANELGSISEIVLSSSAFSDNSIIINEVFSNPAGADTGQEWAELKNQSSVRINLINWRLENSNGKYKFKNDLWLEAEDFYLLNNAESKLAFKNSSDVINLYNDLDELADTVEYADAVQGETYARGANGKLFWTTKVTPGQENVISLSGSESVVLAKASGAVGSTGDYIETTLEKVKDLEIGSLVKVSGTVAVEPGILGVQIFYIATSSADAQAMADKSAGIQIYNYKKDFPVMKVGDQVEISGELSQTQTEMRLKTKIKDDIKIMEHGLAPAALALSCDAVSEENIGQLITVSGEITDKKSATAYVDDGNGEILVYFKQSAGLDTKSLKAGQKVTLTGILSKTSTGLRLLPRYQEDIVKIDQAAIEPQVLGESIVAGEWALAERDKKLELFKYLLIIAGGVIVVLAGLFIKASRRK